ncbi:hypothetical protein GX48_05689 [Paracoccidioides brasiliensis]|nr:hypothetical protein GX48_05689 [Paracoccidioides brasiliensis]
MIETPGPYLFYKHKHPLPKHLLSVMPAPYRHAAIEAERTGGASFSRFRFLQSIFGEHYYYTASPNDLESFNKHKASVHRLLNWKVQRLPKYSVYNAPILGLRKYENEFLFGAAKIPRFVVNLRFNQSAYEEFTAQFEAAKHRFLNGTYMTWLNAKKVMDNLMANPYSLMPVPEKLMVREWWDKFAEDVGQWEEELDALVLPKWEFVVQKLQALEEEAVDFEGEWDLWC